MGNLRNILLIALWLGAKGLVLSQPAQQQGGTANARLVISRRVTALPQQQGGGQQQQQPGGSQLQGGGGASWIGTGTNCTIPVGGRLWGQFDLGYQSGLAGARGQVHVDFNSTNVSQITWGPPGSTNTNPPVLSGVAGQSVFFNVLLSPTSTGPGQEPWSIVIRVGNQTSTISGIITVTMPGLPPPPPPPPPRQQQWPPPLGVPVNGWKHTNVVTLHMGLSGATGKLRLVKHGIYGPAGFMNLSSLNPRMRLRGYR